MPYLLDSICTIIGVYYKYAQPHGGSFTLKRREMKRLIQKEFAEVIKNPHDPRTVELMFQMLDSNGDGLVDFSEYLLLIFKVAKACYSHLKPREGLLRKEEISPAPSRREPKRDERDHHQARSDVRQERNVHERGGSDQMYLHPTQAPAQRQERRDYHLHELVTQVDQRSHQGHHLERRDPRGRDHLSHEHRKQEDDYMSQTQYRRQTEVKTHQQAHDFEPEKDEIGHRQVKERQPAIEEDHQYRSRNLIQGRKTDEDQGPNGEPLDAYDSLPREQARRPQFPDPEWERRRTQRHEAERRERSRSNDPEWSGDERRGQQQRAPLPREAEHREDQRHEPERQKSGFPDQDRWGRSYTSQPIRRAEVDDHQGPYASEHREREERRLHPSEPEPKRRIPQPYESEAIEGDKKRPQRHQGHHQDGESERRRPEPSESESIRPEYRRPMIRGQEDNQRRERYYEPESQERGSPRRRTHDFELRQGETETTEAREPVIREEVRRSQYHPERDLVQRGSPACEPAWRKEIQGRQQCYEPRSWEQENERIRKPQMHDSEPREGERRRPQMANLRQDEKERSQSINLLNRTLHQASSDSSEYNSRRINQSREQTYEFGLREDKWRTRQLNDSSYRDGEQRKQMYCVPEALEREHQMRARPHISERRGIEPNGLRQCYLETRDGEIKSHLYHRYEI